MRSFKEIYSALKYLSSSKKFFYPNVLKTSHGKFAAVSYLTRPYVTSISAKHSNSQEAVKISEILESKGYNVDAIDASAPQDKLSGLRASYDLIFGIEPNFLYLSKKYPKANKIYYATGAYCGYQNRAEENRVQEANKRRSASLSRKRIVAEHNSSDIADGVISIGNDWTKSTYKGHSKKIESIHVSAFSFFPYSDTKAKKDWNQAKNSFLWFGSVGAVHKGLDILLEVFPKYPGLNLYICGAVDREEDFVNTYHKELFETKNIHFVGWTDPNSKTFRDVVLKCAFTIMPSCSEGMSSSIATCMFTGLIPVISRESGVDVDGAGVIFKDCSIGEVEKTILSVSQKPLTEIKRLAGESYKLAEKSFSLKTFEEDFKKALEKLI